MTNCSGIYMLRRLGPVVATDSDCTARVYVNAGNDFPSGLCDSTVNPVGSEKALMTGCSFASLL